jgi:hypothetical protein
MEGKGVKAEEIIGILMSEEIIGLNRWNSASCTAPPTPPPHPHLPHNFAYYLHKQKVP